MTPRPSVFQLTCDAADIEKALTYLESAGDDASPEDRALIMQRLEEYEGEVEDKMLAIVYVKDELEHRKVRLKAEISTLQKAVKRADKNIAAVKALGVDLFEALIAVRGEEGKKMTLPNETKASLIRKPSYLKPSWSKKNEGLLPDEVKTIRTEKVVDKDALLEWSQTAEMPLDGNGDPVVLIEEVNPTHWAIYGREK